MSHAALSAHTTTTAFAVRNHSKAGSCSTIRRNVFQRKPFVGDRVEHRQSLHTRALHRSHTVCITKVDEAEFQEEVLKSDTPVLVDFWATWCGPCKLIEKPLANLEKELTGKLKIVKVEADPNPGLVEKYKVYGLPTLVVFKDGKVMDGSQREGAISEPELRKYLDKWEVV